MAAVNEALNASPELINQDPCGRGWICKLSGVNAIDLGSLMTLTQYEAHCAREK